MNRGAVGVHQLNDRLREALNPVGTEVTRFGRTFRVGDRVLQTVNNYDKDVFNGDLGWVTGVDHAAGGVAVSFEETGVDYDLSELDVLQPSFAITVHPAQGSEFPAVVVPLLTQHYPMLQRNLLYTAITRGRRLVVVVGSRRALAMAVRNDRPRGAQHDAGEKAFGEGDRKRVGTPCLTLGSRHPRHVLHRPAEPQSGPNPILPAAQGRATVQNPAPLMSSYRRSSNLAI